MTKRTEFTRQGQGITKEVTYIETIQVAPGVSCDVYDFTDDTTCDLGIITVKAGYATPLQKLLQGDSTIEGYLSGKGELHIDQKRVYEFPGSEQYEVLIHVDQTLQWHATTDLIFYEICYPKYQDGRYQNLS
jgi:hypothetical protein